MSIDIELSTCIDDRETRLDGPLACPAKAQEGAQAKAKSGTHLPGPWIGLIGASSRQTNNPNPAATLPPWRFLGAKSFLYPHSA